MLLQNHSITFIEQMHATATAATAAAPPSPVPHSTRLQHRPIARWTSTRTQQHRHIDTHVHRKNHIFSISPSAYRYKVAHREILIKIDLMVIWFSQARVYCKMKRDENWLEIYWANSIVTTVVYTWQKTVKSVPILSIPILFRPPANNVVFVKHYIY